MHPCQEHTALFVTTNWTEVLEGIQNENSVFFYHLVFWKSLREEGNIEET